jgi:hypothetical protein
MRMGRGKNWLVFMFNGTFWYSGAEPSNSTLKKLSGEKMDMKCDLLIRVKNVNYKCLKTKDPGKYSVFTDKVERNSHLPAPGRNC